jgi:hypothetical protein
MLTKTGAKLLDFGLAKATTAVGASSGLSMLAPSELDHLIVRCLAKDPEDRWQSARDVKLQLSWIAGTPLSRPSPTAGGKGSRERLVPVLAGVARRCELCALCG